MSRQDFITGLNYPWRHYGQDFGACGWGYRGLAGAADELRRDFETIRGRLAASGKPLVRVFVFADGRASPEFGPSGEVTGFDSFFFRDFDSLVEAARRTDLLLIPVLLDFRWCYPSSIINGVWLGGHTDIVTQSGPRASFLEHALAPLIDRYGKAAEVFAWDLINEPEWILGKARSWWVSGRDPASLAAFRDFVRDSAAMIHEKTRQRVTLGSARPQWLRYWQGLGLDLYQCHWYLSPWRLRLAARARIRNLDRPCLVGEAPTAGTRVSPAEYLEKARREGYSGILFWSFRAGDRVSNFSRV
ncbi:MAG: hypothetical protein ACE15E_09855 [Acidobacteriota bacterium]